MTCQLKQIQRRFNKASQSYETVANIQKEAAKFLVDKLLLIENFKPKTLLDVGTGTGYLPALLLPHLNQSSFYLNDIAEAMLRICQEKFSEFKQVHYLEGDMMALNSTSYECVMSNFALQWAPDLQKTVEFLKAKSEKFFAFSTLLEGTFEAWEKQIQQYQPIQFMPYPTAEALIKLCDTLKKPQECFEYWLLDIPLAFDSPSSFMRYLQLLGASGASALVNQRYLKRLLKAEAEGFTVMYKIFFGIFRSVS
jgi:malonyl-CoA O-methyltransferase